MIKRDIETTHSENDYNGTKREKWHKRIKGITFSSNNFFSKNTRSQESATFGEIYCDFKLRDVMRKHSGNKRREWDWIMKSRKKAVEANGATNYYYENRDFRTWPLQIPIVSHNKATQATKQTLKEKERKTYDGKLQVTKHSYKRHGLEFTIKEPGYNRHEEIVWCILNVIRLISWLRDKCG